MTLKEQNRLYRAAKKIAVPYRHQPGIIDIDFGMKRVGGIPTDELAIRFKTTKKLEPGFMKSRDIFPATLGEFKTDVIEVQPELHGKFQDPRLPIRPLTGGIQIIGEEWISVDYFGTLGCIFPFRGMILGITNYHVLYGDLSPATVLNDFVGKKFIFQNQYDPARNMSIGKSFGAFNMELDYATIFLDPKVKKEPSINGIRGFTDPLSAKPASKLMLGVTRVVKSGIATGRTFGVVDGRSLLHPPMITIFEDKNDPQPEGDLSRPGDSGAVWVIDDQSNMITLVALNIGSMAPHTAYGSSFDTILKSINAILK
ncbi:hypothetical protein D3C87_273760 [compost metagenome]